MATTSTPLRCNSLALVLNATVDEALSFLRASESSGMVFLLATKARWVYGYSGCYLVEAALSRFKSVQRARCEMACLL